MSQNDDFKGVVPCLDYEGHKPECAHGKILVLQSIVDMSMLKYLVVLLSPRIL